MNCKTMREQKIWIILQLQSVNVICVLNWNLWSLSVRCAGSFAPLVLVDGARERVGDLRALASQDEQRVPKSVARRVAPARSGRRTERPHVRVRVECERRRQLARLDAQQDALLCRVRHWVASELHVWAIRVHKLIQNSIQKQLNLNKNTIKLSL